MALPFCVDLLLWTAADAGLTPDARVLEGFGVGALMSTHKLEEINAGRSAEQRRSPSDFWPRSTSMRRGRWSAMPGRGRSSRPSNLPFGIRSMSRRSSLAGARAARRAARPTRLPRGRDPEPANGRPGDRSCHRPLPPVARAMPREFRRRGDRLDTGIRRVQRGPRAPGRRGAAPLSRRSDAARRLSRAMDRDPAGPHRTRSPLSSQSRLCPPPRRGASLADRR
jgi:hypothetical protein